MSIFAIISLIFSLIKLEPEIVALVKEIIALFQSLRGKPGFDSTKFATDLQAAIADFKITGLVTKLEDLVKTLKGK